MASGDLMNERVQHILGVVLEIPEGDIDERLSAEQTTNWDSIRHLDLVMALEEAFGVSFSSEELGTLTSYRAIMEALGQRGIA
jgi:acyl carrier protein